MNHNCIGSIEKKDQQRKEVIAFETPPSYCPESHSEACKENDGAQRIKPPYFGKKLKQCQPT